MTKEREGGLSSTKDTGMDGGGHCPTTGSNQQRPASKWEERYAAHVPRGLVSAGKETVLAFRVFALAEVESFLLLVFWTCKDVEIMS